MGEVDRAHRVKLVVDEWGSWHRPGTEPFPEAFIGQQNTMRDAVLVMLNLPLALIGGVVGVMVGGGVLSVASLIGFITVFGIATRNGIMLVSHIRHLQEEEGITDLREAVFRGALERLAPILMTALAAGLALIPLALSGGSTPKKLYESLAGAEIDWAAEGIDESEVREGMKRLQPMLRMADGTETATGKAATARAICGAAASPKLRLQLGSLTSTTSRTRSAR